MEAPKPNWVRRTLGAATYWVLGFLFGPGGGRR